MTYKQLIDGTKNGTLYHFTDYIKNDNRLLFNNDYLSELNDITIEFIDYQLSIIENSGNEFSKEICIGVIENCRFNLAELNRFTKDWKHIEKEFKKMEKKGIYK